MLYSACGNSSMATDRKLRVLFVCIGNSCRSPMAEGIARLEASDLFEVSSAGLAPLGSVAKLSVQTLERNGYFAGELSSKPITAEALNAADVIINMSGYPRALALGNPAKVEDWDVPDPFGSDPDAYQRIFEIIQTRVWDLIRRLRARQSALPEVRKRQKKERF